MSVSRRSLIRASLIAAPFMLGELALPQFALAEVPNADPNQWFWFPGHSFCMKATGKDTNGMSGWVVCENGPRQGVPFHKHKKEDESFYVVEGTFEISVGDKTITGGPGTYAFGPREVPHRWTNVGTTRGRIMNVFTPAGFEAMFYELGLPIPTSDAPPPRDPAPLIAQMPAVTAKYGNTRTGDFKFPPPPRKG
jgi:mannose-6-phosphate isomerase-like protein (cupin superfamily)